jgi:hypothetical protein
VAQLNDFVATHLGVIGAVIFVGCVVVVLMIAMLFIQSRRIALLSERLDDLTQGADGQSLEGVLNSHLETVLRVAHDLDEVTARTAILEGGSRLHFGRLGLVRFNTQFDDTGGNQSFALAILDANNDGFVITSLHSRTGTRLYAKAVFGGESELTLGAEEAQAVEIAVSQGGTPAARASKRASKGGSVKAAARPKSPGAIGGARLTRPSNSGPATSVATAAAPAEAADLDVDADVDPEVDPDAAGSAGASLVADPVPAPTEAGSATPSA